jgi:segregation and condensation protein B
MLLDHQLKQIVEAALLAAARPLSLEQLQALFDAGCEPDKKQLRELMQELADDYAGRGIELREVGSGFRIQVRADYAPWVSRLFTERPPKYSRALLETLALIAYRQPITRGEIEDIRGVSVSSSIIKTLTEREWVRVVGHRDVPGKPALYATTKEFLDYFNLQSLSELPTLAEIRDLDSINRELELHDPNVQEPGSPPSSPVTLVSHPTDTTDAQKEGLIELDPDAETDSGVLPRLLDTAQPKAKSRSVDASIEFDPDGETDSFTGALDTSAAEVKSSDETE